MQTSTGSILLVQLRTGKYEISLKKLGKKSQKLLKVWEKLTKRIQAKRVGGIY